MRCKRVLLLTPPLVQTNCPYPATMHLAGFLRGVGVDACQRDLSIKVALDVLRQYGGDEADEILEVLQNSRLPPEAKADASVYIEELALWIRDNVDASFGFSRYAERICASAVSFGALEKLVRRRGVIDEPLERHLEAAMDECRPSVVAVTCPFPGTLTGAFKIAAWIRRRHPRVKTVLGGGFVSSEMRHSTETKVREYFDEIVFDEGYRPMAEIMGVKDAAVPPFVEPCYDGIDMEEYFDVVETSNPALGLWSTGRWKRLVMARGCYWSKCAFCDVRLPYIADCVRPDAKSVVDAMERLGGDFHFVDEAMPPALVRAVSEEILRRGLKCRWWGNIRFDSAYTAELCALMAKAGCIAVTGGLECAVDRLLELMNKGITVAGARRAMASFREAGIMVHAYLMYAFPGQTESEAWEALECVRGLFREGLVQSAFWHRFALTVHSPIAEDPDRFSIRISRPRRKNVFCLNELGFEEPGAPDWDRIGEALELALYNYNQSMGLAKPASYWKKCLERKKSRLR